MRARPSSRRRRSTLAPADGASATSSNTTRLAALNALIGALAGGTIDAAIAAYALEVSRLALFRLPQTGIGFAYEWRSQTYDALVAQAAGADRPLDGRLAMPTPALADLDANPGLPDAEQRARLADGRASGEH